MYLKKSEKKSTTLSKGHVVETPSEAGFYIFKPKKIYIVGTSSSDFGIKI